MRPFPITLISLVLLATPAFSHPAEVHSHHSSTWRRWTNSLISKVWPTATSQRPLKPVTGQDGTQRHHQSSTMYSRDVVLRFNLSSVDEALAIKEAADDLYLDIWEFSENWVDIRVAKDVVPSLINLLPKTLSNSYAPLIPESVLTSLITPPGPSSSSGSFSPSLRTNSRDLFFADYQPLSVIYPWLQLLASMFSAHTRLVHIGYSFEGREILGIRVGTRSTNDDIPSGPRKTIIVTAGTHAREWISTASVNYLAYSLITTYGRDRVSTMMMDTFDWVIIPVTNPDGYEYTWQSDRLWRKNRQPTPLRFCSGIDLDRSFGFKFDSGTAGNPCSESYAGQEPWEATEAIQIREWVRNQTASDTEFVAYMDLHSYSQQVLYPYSYSCDADPPTLENLEELAWGLVRAMYHSSPHGSVYKAAAACEGNVAMTGRGGTIKRLPRLETGGGSALDWFYQEMQVKYAYQIKLRDTGSYGFLLPKEQIIPTGKEVLAAANYLGRFLLGEIGLLSKEELEQMDQTQNVHNSPSEPTKKSDTDEDGTNSSWRNTKLTRLEFRRR